MTGAPRTVMSIVFGILALTLGGPAFAVDAAPEAQSAPVASASPSVTVTAAGDPTSGHIIAHVEIFNLDEGTRTLRVEMSKDDQYGAAYNVTCPTVVDASIPGLTHRCDAEMPTLSEPGDYRVIVTRALSTQVVTTVTVAPFEHTWWNGMRVVRALLDPFTGQSQVHVQFPSVPEAEIPVVLVARVDTDDNGAPDTDAATIPCRDVGDRTFDCDTGDTPLPPLCTDVPFGAPTCVGAESRYWFAVNGHVTTLVHEATHRQLSEFERGLREAEADKAAGMRLDDTIDLDSFVLSSQFVCRNANAASCHQLGYYTKWMRLLVDDWPGAVQYVDVDRNGSHARVSAAAGVLPGGRHGTHLQISYGRADGTGDRLRTSCGGATCSNVEVSGLEQGDYEFQLELFNDHPAVRVEDYDGVIEQWGQNVLARSPAIVVPEREPSVAGSVEVDPVSGRARLSLALLDVAELADPYRLGVQLDDVSAGESVFSGDVTCPPFVDTANPSVTHRCAVEFAAPRPGKYLLTVSVGEVTLRSVEVEVGDIDGWWEHPVVRSLVIDRFTGFIDIDVSFPDAPVDLFINHLDISPDVDGDGVIDGAGGTMSCGRDASGMLVCQTEDLPPLCTSGPFVSTCSGAESYLVTFRGNPTGLSIPASFTQMSRYEEGVFFGDQDFASDVPYDVGDFVLSSTDECNEVDAPHCFDDGYYLTWMGRFVRGFTAHSDGLDFIVNALNRTATIHVKPPRLPTGVNGVSLQLAYGPVGTAPTIIDLICTAGSCEDVVVRDLAEGRYAFVLRAFNNHPRVDVVDRDGTEGQWGQTVIASLAHDPITIGEPVPAIGGTVTDSHGKPLRGIVVTASSRPTASTMTFRSAEVLIQAMAAESAVTDKDGHFAFADLMPGVYTLTFTDPSGRFKTVVLPSVKVDGSGISVTVTLIRAGAPSDGTGGGTDTPLEGALPDTGGARLGDLVAGVAATGLGVVLVLTSRLRSRRQVA